MCNVNSTNGTDFCSCNPVLVPTRYDHTISNHTSLYKSLILIRPMGCAFTGAVILMVTRSTWTCLPSPHHPFHELDGTLLICDITGFTAWVVLTYHLQPHCNHSQLIFSICLDCQFAVYSCYMWSFLTEN